ncbi:M23 family metallopeptidase [Roseitranquillus sediminis]|uniref:M23 family metallopeptidase n=1 Tax=Roseitranquillus sediminis TaxID=2809051 RepID=UPI001D0C43A8|nr:M23 family metallopeptidase [Roseitranquillus sediminis]MBM9595113.1 M23 family metallopeptidase [Roseitranquillus sediminis]
MTVEAGDTFDSLLSGAEIDAQLRSELALAVQAEYDLRQLRPGHRLVLERDGQGTPRRLTLDVDGGVQIEVVVDETPSSRTIRPEAEDVERAADITVERSIFAALDEAGAPVRFSVELAQMLAGVVDFRRDLSGGERLELLWRERLTPEGERVSEPVLTYAALRIQDRRLEIVWPENDTRGVTIFEDGEVLRVVSAPIEGARLSSVFGRRKHPILGSVRMHTGVDYAAPRGTPVMATAPGRVSFVGRRSGYGRVVEIKHGADIMTRYAHLSGVTDGLERGQRVDAGEVIGAVGSTGLATGPNLHYEVRAEGRPVDPLDDERLARRSDPELAAAALERLEKIRLAHRQLVRGETEVARRDDHDRT